MCFQIIIYIFFTTSTSILAKNIRILGGSNIEIQDYPHIVSIRYFDSNKLICSGSIISKWNILTAAHCLYGLKNDYSNIRVYSGTSSIIGNSGSKFEIENVIFPPEFREIINTDGVLPRDICLIKLKRFIRFNRFQNKIALPTRSIVTGDPAIFFGWGKSQYYTDNSFVVLKKVLMIIYDKSDCLQKIKSRSTIYDDQFCTFNDNGFGISEGDSGGSVIYNGELFGIITDTIDHIEGMPDIHTTVYYYLDFIRYYMKK